MIALLGNVWFSIRVCVVNVHFWIFTSNIYILYKKYILFKIFAYLSSECYDILDCFRELSFMYVEQFNLGNT